MVILQDGDWRGRRCFVLGGGGSLRHFDFSLLDDELTLGVNMAFLHDPTATLVGDRRLIWKLNSDPRWQAYSGAKYWLNSEALRESEAFLGVVEIREHLGPRNLPKWSASLKDGLWRRTNAGASALNLAVILGADPIYLLGFDLDPTNTGNWHDEYGKAWHPSPEMMQTYTSDFDANADNIQAQVINLNPHSSLRCFPFAPPDQILCP